MVGWIANFSDLTIYTAYANTIKVMKQKKYFMCYSESNAYSIVSKKCTDHENIPPDALEIFDCGIHNWTLSYKISRLHNAGNECFDLGECF